MTVKIKSPNKIVLDRKSILSDNTSQAKKVLYYISPTGRIPFKAWMKTIKNEEFLKRIVARIRELAQGHSGDYKRIKGKLEEIRLHFGPGYRLYYARLKDQIILLLVGGDKSSQQKDIKKAEKYLEDYLKRSK